MTFVKYDMAWFARFTLCAVALGCGGGSSRPDQAPGSSASKPTSLEEICDASCSAQTRLACSKDLGEDACHRACIDMSKCSAEWQDLNWCMANAPLSCDAQGYASVSSADCGDEIDGFGMCLQE
jgi:hypothetical protein